MLATRLVAALSMLVRLTSGLALTDTITWGGDNSRTGYQINHNMDPAIVGSSDFAQIFKTQLPGTYVGAAEQIFSQPLVYTPSDGVQYVYFATTQNNVYKLNAKTGEIVASRNLAIPFLTADLDGCVDISPAIGVTSTGVIDPDTDTLYLTSKTYANQAGGAVAQGRPAGRYYIHALSVDDLSERPNFPVNLEGLAARNNPVRTFNGGIQHQRPALLHSGQYIYAGFASHCVQYNFTGWIIGWDKTTGAIVEHFATEGDGVPNTTPGGGIWMSGGGLASDDQGSLFFGTGNGYASQLSTIPVEGRNPPTSLEEAAVHMTLNSDGTLTLVDFFMPQEKQALDGADKDLGTSPLELLPSEFSCGDISRIGVITGKSGKTYFLNLDDLGGYRTGADSSDRVIQVYQNENSVYAGAGVYPLEGGYIYINVIQYPSHVFKFSCDAGVPSFTKVADSPESNAYILGVSHGTVTSLNGEPGTGLLWTCDVQGKNLRIYDAVPEDGLLKEIKSFSVPGTTKFTRAVFGNGRVYMGTMMGYVYGFGAPINEPLNCTSPKQFGSRDLADAAETLSVTCTAEIGVTVNSIAVNSTSFSVSSLPTLPLTLTAGQTFTFQTSFKPVEVGLQSDDVILATTNSAAGYSSQTPVSLYGTGTSQGPLLAISPKVLTFSNVILNADAGGVVETVIFSNEGNSTLTISSIQYSEVSATGPFETPSSSANGITTVGPFKLSGLPSTIAANGADTVSVNFKPTVAGNTTMYVVVQSTGGSQTFKLMGSSGPAPVCLLQFQTPDGSGWVTYEKNVDFSFGNVTENTSLNLKLRVTNNGGPNAVPLSLTVSKPPFGVSGIIGAANQVDLAEGTTLKAGESADATLFCAVPKEQWNTDPYNGTALWTMNTNDPNWDKQYIEFVCNAVSEQAPPLQADGEGVYRYVGCFKENNPGRQLKNQLYSDPANTIAKCVAACAAGSYTYCGVQYQSECWAGPTIPIQQVSESDCNYACSGSLNQICGGSGVGADEGGAFISLFAVDGASTNSTTTNPTTPTGPSVNPGAYGYVSIGCYTEATNGRALTNFLTTTNQTVDDCLAAAAALNYRYAGLEYGGECWSANSFSAGAVLTDISDCSMTCNGNGSEYCGGPSRLNAYKLNSTASVPPTSSATPTPSGGPVTNPGVNGYTFVGCYHEPAAGRAFATQLSVTNRTIANCLNAAAAAGYAYAAVEYGGECWSGNTINAGATKTTTSSCSMLCNGNQTEYCGGSLLMDVYLRNGTSVMPSPVSSSAAASASATTTAPAAVHTTKPTVGNWTYVGCYTEATSMRALSSLSQTNANMTYEECASYCSAYAYFGVEYSDQCYCGNFFNTGSVQTSESDCSMYCAGDATEFCGAGSRLNVYYQKGMYTGPPEAVARIGDYAYLGCYTEATGTRALSASSTSTPEMTEELCATFCGASKYAMFGVEYGSQCFCGNSLNAGSTHVNDTKCSMPCAGNDDELCGAGNILNVFTRSPVASSSSSVPASPTATPAQARPAFGRPLSPVAASASAAASSSSASLNSSSSSSSLPSSSSTKASSSSAAPSSTSKTSSSASVSSSSPLVSSSAPTKSASHSSVKASPSSTASVSSLTSATTSSSSMSSSPALTSSSKSSSSSTTPASSSSSRSTSSSTSTSTSVPSSSSSSSPLSSSSPTSSSSSSKPSFLSSSVPSSSSATSSSSAPPSSSSSLVSSPSTSATTASSSSTVESASSVAASPSVSPVVAEGNTNFTLYNCVEEPTVGSLLSTQQTKLSNKTMTVQKCLGHCWMYKYAGLENGRDCWCGDSLNVTQSAILKVKECDDLCTGNSTEYCGGDETLLVYKLKDNEYSS